MVASWCTVIYKHVSASTCSAILLAASLYLPVEFASADLNFSLSSTLLAPVFASGPQISNANEWRSFRQLNEDLKGELKAKDFYKAENIARAMLAKWPNEALSYAAMGEVKKAQRIYSESLKCFNQALEKPFSKPGDRCEVLIGRADLYKLTDEDALLLADCRLALKSPEVRASQCSHIAQLLTAIDSPVDSIAACDRGLALKSDNFSLMRLKATNLSSLKRFGEAEVVLLKALALASKTSDYKTSSDYKNSNEDKTLRELAFVRSYMKKYAEAISSFDTLLSHGTEREVRQMEVLQERANCHFALGHYDKCVADLSACIKMYPLNRYLYSKRAEAYLKLGELAKARADKAKMNEFDHSFKPL
ncbi:hypothetical protein BH11CYA1_BH11CYA1_16860 [soil metagenome]